MVCVDTTFLIDLIHKNSAAEKKLSALAKGKDGPSTTVITVAELFYGAYKLKECYCGKREYKAGSRWLFDFRDE